MRRLLLPLAAFAAAGCGNVDTPVSGVVRYQGQPLKMPPSEEGVTATFLGLDEAGHRTDFAYMAIVQPDGGQFTVWGPDRKGIPKGKYKVAVSSSLVPVGVKEKAKDFWAPYGAEKTPLTVEVGRRGVEMTIDLDAPPAGKKI